MDARTQSRRVVGERQRLEARVAGERLFAARARLDGRTRDAEWHEAEAIRLAHLAARTPADTVEDLMLQLASRPAQNAQPVIDRVIARLQASGARRG